MVDFSKRLNKKKIEKKVNPIDIYETVDRKSDTGPLRPAQTEILESWYNQRKEERDLIVKLHTGEGKTLVGLLILQSVINSNEGPCLYVCPNIYLVSQVCAEAEKFGIGYCTIGKEGIPNDFISGEKILITHAQKLFNGLSIFGINNSFTKVGTIILDDSHTCIDTIKDAFSISIDKKENTNLYNSLISLFEDDLREQGEGSFLDITYGNYDTLLTVPYWSWYDKKSEVLDILSKHNGDNQVKFSWPLLKDSIEHYTCYITSSKIEISPYYPNVNDFPTFSKARHRILMSATTQDDSFFIKGLDFNINSVQNPLVTTRQKWSGEKMIIVPSLIHDNLDRDLIVTKFSQASFKRFGSVALVPSTRKAHQYKAAGAVIADSQNIVEEIDKIKNKNFEKLLVINNRYDGIDLPDEDCRILIIDSIPYFNSLSDRYEEVCRPSSEIMNKRIAQKIEQGLGRGVRGEKDYCVIIIIGSDLVKFIRSIDSRKYFSAQTKKQIDIGLSIAEMTKEDEAEENQNHFNIVISLMKQSVDRDESWKQYYIDEMDSIIDYTTKSSLYEKLAIEREIEKDFLLNDYESACEKLQEYIDKYCSDELEKGWYLQQLARFYYKTDRIMSNDMQKAAFKNNNQLLKPKSGIAYKKVSYINQNRLAKVRDFLVQFQNYGELQLATNEILDNLSFGINSNKFESSLQKVGEMLGFISQRPDKDIRKGPDNLWCGVENHYFIFECKNEVSDNREEINKHEAGQMNSHCAWFKSEYGDNVSVSRFLIIPTKNLSYQADFEHDVKIIRKGKMRDLKQNIKHFIDNLHSYSLPDISDDTLQKLLSEHHLDIEDLKIRYSENYYHKTK
ncbi:DEAD/DEAH box helicase family protein [Lactococcus lactis]|uniref:DEAD/DEAH box helicase family protein n=1 Tax=Lactococcus lactis TaxID=1358 RepID=UPI0025A0A20A|nr:DEAD/DEAH box helicase family protein [Lactococcus lactis]MDM7652271.1 DEAD/DEAH box helicase family protein [Lactococcus lactis]